MEKYILFFCLILFSCKNGESENKINIEDKKESADSLISKDHQDLNSSNSKIDIGLAPVVTETNEKKKSGNSQSDIQTKIFRNENSSGYGYDIILNGHVYVHQPNIPAIPGNNGFATPEQAQKIADLVTYKIRNNILPPTVSVKEMDSLGIK